ncbi:SA1002 family membrane protein [Staphylococcus simulans]|uniref:SA1002 family membrane protein n=1 Tax=Staphylococcus simulans TaxID=1286 RepID=UPI003F7E532E
MNWLNFILIIIMFFLIDYFANLGKRKHVFIKSSMLIIILIVSSSLSLILGLLIIIGIDSFINLGNSLFTLGLLSVLASSIIEFFIMHAFFKKWFHDDLVLTIAEYFIQWLLVYLTLYQVVTQSISKIALDVDPQQLLHMLNIEALNLVTLPILLISWINIIMHKINFRDK